MQRPPESLQHCHHTVDCIYAGGYIWIQDICLPVKAYILASVSFWVKEIGRVCCTCMSLCFHSVRHL